MKINEFKKKCYELYQLDWIMSHGYSLQDIFKVLREGYSEFKEYDVINDNTDSENDFDNVVEYFEERGFNGNIFTCEDEFYDSEYKDVKYMAHLLPQEMFNQYCEEWTKNINKQYNTSPEQMLIDIINSKKAYVKGELELNLENGIWIAMDYRSDLNSAVPIEIKNVNSRIISVEEAKTLGINVRKCCDICNVAYVG